MDFKYNTYLHLCSSYSVYHNQNSKKLLILIEDVYLFKIPSAEFIFCVIVLFKSPQKSCETRFSMQVHQPVNS